MCWESDGVGVSLTDEPSGDYQDVHIDPQARTACALDDDGYITCWGYDRDDVATLCVEEDEPGFSGDYFGCNWHE